MRCLRTAINLLNARSELREIEWLPPTDSPLYVSGPSVSLLMDSIIGPRTLA